jgi:uroporphyrinogen decarboxylase
VNREKVDVLLERLIDYTITLVHEWADLNVDAIYISDDWGLQDRLMISPELWRDLFKPCYRRVIVEAHKRKLKVFMHSCGNIMEIIPDLIEIGLDVLNPIQPGALDHGQIAKEFGGKITFFGGIDVQSLPAKSTEEVEREIERLVETFGGYNGGLIFCTANSVVPETPLRNIEAMLRACQRYRYPK